MGLIRRPGREAARLRLLVLSAAFLALLGVLTHTALQGVSAMASPAANGAQVSPAREIPSTDVNPYGANFFLSREVEEWKRERTLRMAAEGGIGWVKQQFPWAELEPQRKGEYLRPGDRASTWLKFDDIVALCEAYGLRIVARLDLPPAWSRQDNSLQNAPPDRLEDYGDFVYEFVRHYRGRIGHIQIWNEPNIYPEWGNRPVDPAEYVEMLKIAYRRAKEADPNVYVLSAPLAFTLGEPHPEPGRWRSMNDLTYLEGMYQAGAGAVFDILSTNAFGMDRPPEDPPDPNVLNFQRVLLQREIMVRYGDADKPVWFNEYGWNAAPETFTPDAVPWKRVTEAEQAEYTVRGIELARREWPWAGVLMTWYFRQVGHIPDTSAEYYFRMVDPDFTPRPVYLAVQRAAQQQAVPGPGTYQETHPAVKPQGRWENVIDPDAQCAAYVTSDAPGDSVTLTFRGTRLDLRTRRHDAAGRLLVVLDGHTVPGLPTDERGRSYVDLYSPSPSPDAWVGLVREARPGQHTVTVTVAEDAHPSSRGRACAIDAFEVSHGDAEFPFLQTGLLALALAGDGWLLWATWRRVRPAVLGGR
jgi:hypothetical protein